MPVQNNYQQALLWRDSQRLLNRLEVEDQIKKLAKPGKFPNFPKVQVKKLKIIKTSKFKAINFITFMMINEGNKCASIRKVIHYKHQKSQIVNIFLQETNKASLNRLQTSIQKKLKLSVKLDNK